MPRPVKPRTASEHLLVLSRLARSLELDSNIPPRRKKRLLHLAAQLMAELQKAFEPP